MAIQTATDANFDELIQSGAVLVDFWAAWCGPCRMLGPVLEDIDQKTDGRLTIVKLNVDKHGDIAGRFGIMSLPTMILFKDGAEAEKIIGYQSKKALLDLIVPHLQPHL